MDLQLRLVASHPRASASSDGSRSASIGPAVSDGLRRGSTEFALSSRRASIVLGHESLLVEQSTAVLGIRTSIRTPYDIEKVVYVGGAAAYIAFLEDQTVAVYAELRNGGIEFTHTHQVPGDGRSVALASGSQTRNFAVFAKAGSPSVHCVYLAGSSDAARVANVAKLRADILGAQENVGALGEGFAKLKSRVATKTKDQLSAVLAVAAHPVKDLASAAYENGILRVWDVRKKELRGQYDAQLLLRERLVDIGFHPDLNVLVACTTMGRVLVFQVRGTPMAKGEAAQLPVHRMRDRTRRYVALSFLPGSPSYLLLLTSTRRIVARLIDHHSHLVASKRFTKASRVLDTIKDGAGRAYPTGSTLDAEQSVSLLCEPRYGLIGIALDDSGNALLFQRMTDKSSAVRRPVVGAPIGTPFSTSPGKPFTGAVNFVAEGLFSHSGRLYLFELGANTITCLCSLPKGSEVRRVHTARDQFGSITAALVFLYMEGETDPNALFASDGESTSQYVLATRRGDGEGWNVSEPSEGAGGCFLNQTGRHDRILILSVEGKTVSVRSFSSKRLTKEERRGTGVVSGSRGVQRFGIGDHRVHQVFRSPFSGWCAVVYEDQRQQRLSVSRNAYRRTASMLNSEYAMDDDTFMVDDGSFMYLRRSERTVDIQWQKLPSSSGEDQYLGAIMTTERLYIVKDVYEEVAKLDFSAIGHFIIPFTVPTMCWMGPSVMVLFGQYLYSITLDGRADHIAGMSEGENACALAAVLPDRVVYIRPSQSTETPMNLVSRPVGMMSVLVRGILGLPSPRRNQSTHYMEMMNEILLSRDASQGSEALIDALIRQSLSPIAYILVASERGRLGLPPLKQAGFLGRIGDLRGALRVAEAEYAKLPSPGAFHNGSELYRLLQRILNMSMASGDFQAGRRCSELLGRRGTFSAFVDSEGGYVAVSTLCKYARKTGNKNIAETLAVLVEKSAKSCIATDSSQLPTPEELRNARAGIESFDRESFQLGSENRVEMSMTVPPVEDADGRFGQARREPLAALSPSNFVQHLEQFVRSSVVQLKNIDDDGDRLNESGFLGTGDAEGGLGLLPPSVESGALGAGGGSGRIPGPGGGDSDLLPGGGGGSAELLALTVPPRRIERDVRVVAASAREQAAALGQETRVAVRDTSAARRREISKETAIAGEEIGDFRAAFQEDLRASTGRLPEQRAARSLDLAYGKLMDRRYGSALREVRNGIGVLGRARAAEGYEIPNGLMCTLVHYQVALQVMTALEEIARSPQGATVGGRVTTAQLASALASIPLRPDHMVSVLMLSMNANLGVGNYGIAGREMGRIREIGGSALPAAVRMDLRGKYDMCMGRGFANAMPNLNTRLCWQTLRPIEAGMAEAKCSFCPAFFSVAGLRDEGIATDEVCPACTVGTL